MDATVYPDIEEYFEDVTGVYRDEIAALADAGCKYVQIDNTDAAYICDPKFQAKSREQGMEPEEQIALQGRMISAATRGRPDDVAVSMHICRGNSAGAWIASGGYDFIAETSCISGYPHRASANWSMRRSWLLRVFSPASFLPSALIAGRSPTG